MKKTYKPKFIFPTKIYQRIHNGRKYVVKAETLAEAEKLLAVKIKNHE